MAWYSKRHRVLFLLALGIVLIGGKSFMLYVVPPVLEEFNARTGRSRSADEQVVTQVKVTQPYLLQWRARAGVPALQLLLPPAAFGGWRRAELSSVGQTADGPALLDLEVLVPGPGADSAHPPAGICSVATLAAGQCGFGRGQLRLWRDNLTYAADFREVLDGKETLDDFHEKHNRRRESISWLTGAWIKEGLSGGTWEFQGWDCSAAAPVTRAGPKRAPDDTAPEVTFFSSDTCFKAPGRWARWFPALYGLKRQKVVAICAGANLEHCTAAYYFRDRLVELEMTGWRSPLLLASMAQLTQWAADAAAPPPSEEQLKRAQQALTHCEALARLFDGLTSARTNPQAAREVGKAAESQCGHAVQLARTVLTSTPAPAAPLPAASIMLRAIATPGYYRTRWDHYYGAEILGALTKAGQAESIAAIEAHAIILRAPDGEAESRRVSLEALVTLTPKLVAADHPLFVRIEEIAASAASEKSPQTRAGLDAFRTAWLEKAERDTGTDSDLALWIRHHSCMARMFQNQDRATLNVCADRLFAAWQTRATVKPGGQIARLAPAHFAVDVARLYQSYAYASADFASALTSIRAVQAFTAIDVHEAQRAAALRLVDEIERDVAAKVARG